MGARAERHAHRQWRQQKNKGPHLPGHNLTGRVNEIDCLYSLSKLDANQAFSMEEILQRAVSIFPAAMQYSEDSCARITLDDQAFLTDAFEETRWRLACDIMAFGEHAGTVEIFYREEKPPLDHGPFLAEERHLLFAAAEYLGRIAERKWAERALKTSHLFLEMANTHTEMMPLLQEFVIQVRRMTGCNAVGIRLLDADGNIPYEAYEGFSSAFYTSENPLSTRSDQCMCINLRGSPCNWALPSTVCEPTKN